MPRITDSDGRCWYCQDTGFHYTWTSNAGRPVVSRPCSCEAGERIRNSKGLDKCPHSEAVSPAGVATDAGGEAPGLLAAE